MSKDLFSPDIFSSSLPKFIKSNVEIEKLLKNIISKNYNQISNEIIHVEQFQGNEINSNNYKVTTASGSYLIKKFMDIDEINKLKKILKLNNWLIENNIHSPKAYLNNANELLLEDASSKSYWAIFDFIEGSFFSGQNDDELKSVACEIGLLFKKLKKAPPKLHPLQKIEHFKDSKNLMKIMQDSSENWTNYFGEDLSNELKSNWKFIKKSYSKLLKSKDLVLHAKKTPSHIDLHPHNILTQENKIKSILDINSIKLEFNLVALSFSIYKLLRHTISARGIGNNTQEISRVSHIYFNSLSNEFPSIKKEINNLYIYAIAEIFRRIFIIFSLNIYNNDSRWNHVLLTHLNGLREAKIIFGSLKSNLLKKTPKNILFRADSSSAIGTGHIMRDLVLAKKYAAKGHNIIFATQDLQGNINYKIDEAGYVTCSLKSNDFQELNALVKELGIDMIVIDHYGIDFDFEKKLKIENSTLKILVFDDTYEKHHCDILLNHNISADKKRYKNLVPKSCKLRCGSKYTLLRDEFYKEEKKRKRKIKHCPKEIPLGTKLKIFIAMGGADTANLNIKILHVLKKYKNIKVRLATTLANKNLKELEKYTKNKPWIRLHVNTNKIAKLMRKSDFAIITPSVTANEAFFMELPFIAIKTAKNQNDMYKYLKKKQLLVLREFDSNKLLLNLNKLSLGLLR